MNACRVGIVWWSSRSRLLPPLLLTVVALLQIVLARTADLTAWKGGGFGMFSTLDHGAYRGVDIVVDGPDRSESLEIPPSLEIAAARAAAFPVDWLMRDLAEGVVARERRYERAVSRVTLTAWRAEFDRAALRASERPLRTFVYDVP
jgi:hypothetical protein